MQETRITQSARLHFVFPATLALSSPDVFCLSLFSFKVFVYLLMSNIKPRLFLFLSMQLPALFTSEIFYVCHICIFGHQSTRPCFASFFFSFLISNRPATKPNISLGNHGKENKEDHVFPILRTHTHTLPLSF
ncbi:hypothetical protein F7725_003690 [Dissostichus mawsoni]|uniref:Uncharacterized protein n=1 Tax=Dissostichus mawsoni TaxID=36200 RepID=A0A7J5YAX0_DISMA|nr:hypothetical protein F7725_003690 [Dissostichus mawsoni]